MEIESLYYYNKTSNRALENIALQRLERGLLLLPVNSIEKGLHMKEFDYSLVKNPEYFKDGRMEAHSDHITYANVEEAFRR